jgi:hypothetical protein
LPSTTFDAGRLIRSVFRINLNARVYISAADHEIRFGKPRDKRSSQHTLIGRCSEKNEVTTPSSGGPVNADVPGGFIEASGFHPHDWIAQRRFDTLPLETCSGVRYACLGIFTLDGQAVGACGRIAAKPLIDHDAQDIAVLIRRKDHGENDWKRTV